MGLFNMIGQLGSATIMGNAAVTGAYLDYEQDRKQRSQDYDIWQQQRDLELAKQGFAEDQFAFQKKVYGNNRHDQYKFAQNAAKWEIQQQMKAAETYGIHPLAMLGKNSGRSASPISVGSVGSGARIPSMPRRKGVDWARHFSNIGQAGAMAMNSLQLKKAQYDIAKDKNETKRQKLENKILENRLQALEKGYGTQPNQTPSQSRQTGVKDGDYPLNQISYDARGNAYVTVSENASEIIGDEAPIVDRIGYTINRLAEYSTDFRATMNPNHPDVDLTIGYLRQTRSRLRKLPPGYEYRYNVFTKTWRPRFKKGGNTQLFDHWWSSRVTN